MAIRCRKLSLEGWLALTGVVALAIAIVLPSLNRMRDTAGRVPCASNLRQIGQAVMLYANDNGGAMPMTIAAIKTQDVGDEIFQCQVTKKRSVYLAPTTRYADLGPDTVVAHEALDSHNVDGVNVLFGDGRVEFITLRPLKEALSVGPTTLPSTQPAATQSATQP